MTGGKLGFSFVGKFDLDDDFLDDPRYTEIFKETYLQPIDGHRVFAIQPGINVSTFAVFKSLCIFERRSCCVVSLVLNYIILSLLMLWLTVRSTK